MLVEATTIDAVKRLVPRRHGDDRGFFSETWSRRAFAEAGIDVDFVQDNHSLSSAAGTLRGLHYQAPPHAQGKLVRCLRGAILDVAVDVRRGSDTYGRWVSAELSADNGAQLWVPAGFLHGFLTLTPMTEVAYKVTDYYAPECDGAVRFDDPDIGVDWGMAAGDITVSAKDAAATAFRDFDTPFAL